MEPFKKYLPHIGVQYIKLKLIKWPFKCKRNYFVFGKKVCVGRTQNLDIRSKFWRDFEGIWEMEDPWGLKGYV